LNCSTGSLTFTNIGIGVCCCVMKITMPCIECSNE
jgi:hypothetical protein